MAAVRIHLRVVAGLLLAGLLWAAGESQGEPDVLALWPQGAPGALGNDEQDRPTLTLYHPDPRRATGTAVVICPGGGYRTLALDHEGRQVAVWLNSLGITALVLKYRLGPRYRHPAPLQDAWRALRTARARAQEWNLDPGRVGILGFSAGGHLASTAGTHFDTVQPQAADPLKQIPTRPDFMILIYPVITFTEEFTHSGSKRHLLGEEVDLELARSLSSEQQVSSQTPPTFLVHAGDDRAVPPENSIFFFLALRRAGVPAELHLFESGGHGFGLAPHGPILSRWPELCRQWLERHGLLERRPIPTQGGRP